MIQHVEATRDPRTAPFERLRLLMPVPGRQNGDAKLLLEVERKTREPIDGGR